MAGTQHANQLRRSQTFATSDTLSPGSCSRRRHRNSQMRGNRMAIQKVGVVGCGLMGSGIAQVSAQAGFQTVVREVSGELVEKGLKGIEKNLARLVEKGALTETAKSEIRGRLQGTASLEGLKDCDVIMEAIIEQLPAKRELFSALDSICGPNTIFASNTSSLTITEIAAATKRPERFVGLHFFNPVPVMKLVEVVRRLPPIRVCMRRWSTSARNWGRRRCGLGTAGDSSSTVCWCRICWTLFAHWRRASAPCSISTTP